MWPWGHLAVGYLAYTASTALRWRRSPEGLAVVLLAVGTQFPDIVDKPLAYWFSLLPEGRSMAHSLLVVVPVCLLVVALSRRLGHAESGLAFTVGYVTHLAGDGYAAAISGEVDQLSYLAWPVLPAPDYPAEDFAHHARKLVRELGKMNADRLLGGWADPFVLQVWLTLAVVGIWILDGVPPLGSLGRWAIDVVTDGR